MIPVKDINDVYPKFVPDQLLTSTDLNNLFNFLDQQQRMTRTNLIGIGIVCGLEVKKSSSGDTISVSRGCGVTSQGYLITLDDTVYDQFTEYDVLQQEDYENVFVDLSGSTPQPRFDLLELHPSGVTPETPDDNQPKKLTELNLAEYAVLIFVELLETDNRNCDPSNCDDHGGNVTMTFKPLLIKIADIDELGEVEHRPVSAHGFAELKEIHMPRWNVNNTQPVTTADIFNAYRSVLSPAFIVRMRQVLTDAYNLFSPVVSTEFSTNPFANLQSNFQFLHTGTTLTQLMYMQHYYDFFSDLSEAYREFREKGQELLSECCPDEDAFPRHLLLGELAPVSNAFRLEHRHYFIYSPLYNKRSSLSELRFLFRRMVMMITQLDIPPAGKLPGVTPSRTGVPLSDKSIPFYYNPANLFRQWNYRLSRFGKGNQNLSYHATTYNSGGQQSDPYVNALNYDLDSYNFLRVEGIIGKDYKEVLEFLQSLTKRKRLPIDVIALRTGDSIQGLQADPEDGCDYNLEISYDIARREWEAIIGKTIEYLDDVWKEARKILDVTRLTDFKKDLHKAKPYMTDDLNGFLAKYSEFLDIYESIETRALRLRSDLTGPLTNTVFVPELAEDLIDHFDDVVASCKKGSFRALYQAATSRTPEMLQRMLFYNYAKDNPGLQHKAGVTMGGTFVIVYHYNDDADEQAAGPFSVSGEVLNQHGAAIANVAVVVQRLNLATVTDSTGRFFLTVPELPVTLRADAMGVGTGLFTISDAGNLHATILVPGNGNSSHNPDTIRLIPNNLVIADFYLPYRCCSDCAPIQIVVKEEVPEEPEVVTCGELADLTSGFDVFRDNYKELIERLRVVYQQYNEIEEYYKRLQELIGEGTDKQIDFFDETDVENLLPKWVKELVEHIRSADLQFLRETALALYRQLWELAFYIACIQPGDISEDADTRIPMLQVLEFMHETLRSLLPLAPDLSDLERQQLRLLRAAVEKQLRKLDINNENGIKPIYLAILNKIKDTLAEFSLGT